MSYTKLSGTYGGAVINFRNPVKFLYWSNWSTKVVHWK